MGRACALVVVSLCCLLAHASALRTLGRRDRSPVEAPGDQGLFWSPDPAKGLGQRLLSWLASLVGFYGLVWLLNEFSVEPCPPAGCKEPEVTDCDQPPGHVPCLPRAGCSIQASLQSLAHLELQLVTLLYRLRKHKVALGPGGRSGDGGRRTELPRSSLPNGLVIYTIHDEA